MSTLQSTMNLARTVRINVQANMGRAMIQHTLGSAILDVEAAGMTMQIIKQAKRLVDGNVKTGDELREAMKAYHATCVVKADNFGQLVYPKAKQPRIIGTFVTTGKPTKVNPAGTFSMGKSFGSTVSKLCTILDKGGKPAWKKITNSKSLDDIIEGLKVMTPKGAFMHIVSTALDGRDVNKLSTKELVKVRKLVNELVELVSSPTPVAVDTKAA